MTETNPNIIKDLLKSDAYDFNPKKISLLETTSSLLFKADNFIYKIKKTSNEFYFQLPSIKDLIH